jgi:hypothetical protein
MLKKVTHIIIITVVLAAMVNLTGCFLKPSSAAEDDPSAETWEKLFGAEVDGWAYDDELKAFRGPQAQSAMILTSEELSSTYRVSAQVVIGTAGQWGGLVLNYNKTTGAYYVLRISPRKSGDGTLEPLQIQFLSFTGPLAGQKVLRLWTAPGVDEKDVVSITFERVFENDKWETRIKVGNQSFTDTNELSTGGYAGYFFGGCSSTVNPMHFKALTVESL